MSTTQSASGLRAQVWRKQLFADVQGDLLFGKEKLIGEGDNCVIQLLPDLKEKRGNTITFPLSAKLSGNGVTGDNELEGNEERITAYAESVIIDQIRNGVRLTGLMDEQQNAYDMRIDAKSKLGIWIREFVEKQILYKLAGVTNTSITDVNGNSMGGSLTWSNTPDNVPAADEAAGSGARYLCANYAAGGGGTASMTSNHILTPELITMVKRKARLTSPRIQPLMINGRSYYVMFVHPCQAYDLKQHATYHQALREAEVRGKENPIFTGALGVWDGVILYEHEYVPFLDVSEAGNSFAASGSGTDAAVDLYRALLCGRQAGVYALNKEGYDWKEKAFDYDNQTGFKTGFIGGIQKVQFNSKDYGVIAVDTTATANL